MRMHPLTLVIFIVVLSAGSPQSLARQDHLPAQHATTGEVPIVQLLLLRHEMSPMVHRAPLTETLLAKVAAELDNNPEANQALRAWLGRDTAAPLSLVRRLKQDHALWTLVALTAFDSDTRGAALNALTPFGDPSIVPELAAIARHLPNVASGSEHATLHAVGVTKLRILLSRLTGVWLLDHAVPLADSADRWLAAHEANQLTDIELARRAVARLQGDRLNANPLPPYYARHNEESHARIAFVDALRRAYAHRLKPRSAAGAAPEGVSIAEGVLPVHAALDALHELMLDWNPIGWSRGHVTEILGEPIRMTDASATGYGSNTASYFWDTGLAGGGIRFTFGGDGNTVIAFELLFGG